MSLKCKEKVNFAILHFVRMQGISRWAIVERISIVSIYSHFFVIWKNVDLASNSNWGHYDKITTKIHAHSKQKVDGYFNCSSFFLVLCAHWFIANNIVINLLWRKLSFLELDVLKDDFDLEQS